MVVILRSEATKDLLDQEVLRFAQDDNMGCYPISSLTSTGQPPRFMDS